MRIVAADSGSSILGPDFEPTCVVCTVAVLVEEPYRAPSAMLAEAHFCPIEKSYDVLVREIELAGRLLESHGADVVHFDASLGRARLDRLDPDDIARLWPRTPEEALRALSEVASRASRLASRTGVPVVAMGKESVPIRIAELCCGAFGFLSAARKAVGEGREILLGLPIRCSLCVSGRTVIARSLTPGEHDLIGLAEDEQNITGKVVFKEMPNPTLRGFRMVYIRPSS